MTQISRPITTEEDEQQLQRDLDSLTDWSDNWLLKFHPDKCKHSETPLTRTVMGLEESVLIRVVDL